MAKKEKVGRIDKIEHGVTRITHPDIPGRTDYHGPGGHATVLSGLGQYGTTHQAIVNHATGNSASLGTYKTAEEAHQRAALRATNWSPDKPLPKFGRLTPHTRADAAARAHQIEHAKGGTHAGGMWDESKHPRHPAGTSQGGEFAPNAGMGHAGDVVRLPSGELVAIIKKPVLVSDTRKLGQYIRVTGNRRFYQAPDGTIRAEPPHDILKD